MTVSTALLSSLELFQVLLKKLVSISLENKCEERKWFFFIMKMYNLYMLYIIILMPFVCSTDVIEVHGYMPYTMSFLTGVLNFIFLFPSRLRKPSCSPLDVQMSHLTWWKWRNYNQESFSLVPGVILHSCSSLYM